ncbi:MAG TPA: MHYT domain-containing protein [Jiangellaceae bacterium]
MGHIHHFSHGLYTPGMAFLVMMLGAIVGLRCTLRALNSSGRDRRTWLLMGSTAIGSGIWTLHFIAMLGFDVDGTEVRYNVPLTLLSLVLAIAVVSIGVFIVGSSRATGFALLVGGLITGSGVAVMHYSGMAAVRISGTVNYDMAKVILSIVIALVAAVAALWIVLNIKGLRATIGAALIMGLAVSAMHYTAMWAVGVDLTISSSTRPSGATAFEFLLPLTIGIGAVLFVAATFVAVSPIEDEYEDEIAERMRSLEKRRDEFNAQLDADERARADRARRASGLRTQQSSAAELAGRLSTPTPRRRQNDD